MKFSEQKIVLTGATGGIGQAIAKALDAQGCSLLVTGRNTNKLQQLLSSLQGSHHAMLTADLSTHEGVDALGEEALSFGANGLINGLGANQFSIFGDMSDTDISHLIITNLIVPMNVCRKLLPLFESDASVNHLSINRLPAIIVNVGSILGSIGYPGSAVYCASKFGLRGFTESLRRELADSTIRVIYFAPRATDTELNSADMIALNNDLRNAVDSPEWVAEKLIEVLSSQKTANYYLGWPEKLFVRINGLFPSLVDSALYKQLATIKRYCRIGGGQAE